MKKPEMATLYRKDWRTVNGRGEMLRMPDPKPVRIMARAEGYAMVRKKGAAPFIVREKDLESE